MDLLREIKASRPETAVVMITAHGSEKVAVQAMKAGAQDYVPKPFDNDEIRIVVQRAWNTPGLNASIACCSSASIWSCASRISSAAVRRCAACSTRLRRWPTRISPCSSEARAARARSSSHKPSTREAPAAGAPSWQSTRGHQPGARRERALWPREGAFTGAYARASDASSRPTAGQFSSTRSATWRSRRRPRSCAYSRSGGSSGSAAPSSLAVDVRVVAATHRDLEAEVKRGHFREDLYDRLRVVEVRAPLRERVATSRRSRAVPLAAGRAPRPRAASLDPAALAALGRYAWPGNGGSFATWSSTPRSSPQAR